MRRWFLRGMTFVAALLFVNRIHRFRISFGALLAFGFLLLLTLVFWELAK